MGGVGHSRMDEPLRLIFAPWRSCTSKLRKRRASTHSENTGRSTGGEGRSEFVQAW